MNKLSLSALLALTVLSPGCLDPDEPELGDAEQAVTMAWDGTFLPDAATCSRSIDEHQAIHSYMGGPISGDEYVSGGVMRRYAGGAIVMHPVHGCAFLVRWGMWDHWNAEGLVGGVRGFPVSDEISPASGRSVQYFDRGSLWWRMETGVRGIHGVLARKHHELGTAAGYPITEHTTLLGGAIAYVDLDNDMRLYWTELTGAWSINGAIRTRYETGVEKSWLGMPVSDVSCRPDGASCRSLFQWGAIFWDRDGNKTTVSYSPSVPELEVRVTEPSATNREIFLPSPGCSISIEAHHARNPWLGTPVQAADVALSDGGAYRDYAAGTIVYNPRAKCAFFLINGFRDTWRAQGAQGGRLLYPVSDELWSNPGRAHQYFERGSMWWAPHLGLRVLTGRIAARHAELIRSGGYPSSNQERAGDGERVELENNTSLFLQDGEPRAFALHGAIRLKYASLGWQTSYLRWPQGDSSCSESNYYSRCHGYFNFGDIYWYLWNSNYVVLRDNHTPRPPPEPMPPPPPPRTIVDNRLLWLKYTPPPGTSTGSIVYTALFPDGPPKRDLKLLAIGFLGDFRVPRIALLKRGYDYTACGNPNAVVVLGQGTRTETTAADMTALFGSATPSPYVRVSACIGFTFGSPPLMSPVQVKFSYTGS